jgi:hypothetical protein
MRSKSATRRVQRPRNNVVLAIVQRLATVRGRRHRDEGKPTRQHAELDLAQRVRESGEW